MSAPVIPLTEAPDIVKTDRLDLLTGGDWLNEASWEWTEVKGLKSLTVGNAYSVQDTSTFNTGLMGSDMPTQFKKTVTGTLQKYVAEDPTHLQLREAGEPTSTSAAFGLIAVRIYNRTGSGKAYWGIGYIQWEPQGGSGETVKTNNFTIQMQTWEELDENPNAVAAAVVTLTSALPTGQAAGEWVEVTGTGFNSTVSGITLGGVSVGASGTGYFVLSATKLHFKVPAGTAGAQPLIVTNTAGPSASLSYTRA